MSGSSKTFTVALLSIAILAIIVCMPMSSAVGTNNSTGENTPTATPTVTAAPSTVPTASPTASPVPTPIAGTLFTNAYWNDDHVSVTVTNGLEQQIQVTAYIGSASNNTKYIVDPGATQTLDTPVYKNAEVGQILNFGFIAYLNGTKIDSVETTVTIPQAGTSTPVPQEASTVSGTVVDATNGTPIAGAEVTFTSPTYSKKYTAITGSDGTFTTDKMYPDRYDVTIKAEGYKTTLRTTSMINGAGVLDQIAMEHVSTPTQATVTPLPSPTSALSNWEAIIYNPTVCVGTISSLIAVILGSIGIYEWLSKQRAARKKAEKEVSDKEKAEAIAADMKKASESQLAEMPAEDNNKPFEGDKK
ncbi:MAG TPA: carboxypeptidase-like regulatory domain-containing protein [Methanocellaceae archaeon]|jgi:hypothetical protein